MGAQLGPFDPGLSSALLGHLHPVALASSQRGGLVQEETFKKKKEEERFTCRDMDGPRVHHAE